MTGAEQTARFVSFLEEMSAIRGVKNKDYANDTDSLANFRMVESAGLPAWIGIWCRLGDKYARMTEQVRKVLKGEPIGFAVGSEGFHDLCLDGANYFALADIAFEEWAAGRDVVTDWQTKWLADNPPTHDVAGAG